MAASRGRKVGIVLIILLVALVGLFVASDRIAAYAAERTIASQAKKELVAREISSPSDPKVAVGGFPFLTQVARGRYEKITIHIEKPSSQGVTFDALDVTATGVNATTSALVNGTGSITADDVSGTTSLGWEGVNKLMNTSGFGGSGATASALPDGQVRVRVPVSVAGISTNVIATGNLSVGQGSVHLKINEVTTEGGTLPAVISRLVGSIKQSLSVDIKIPALPYNLQVKDVKASEHGLAVTATAANVPLSGGRAGS
ncbi:MAG: hypothetical protein AUI14_02335 [Actinobacteria bacterium 13_2_20CM_2_71_6]|nr:MAG: hypothetical protein AUI14_02335 [Actinobacteria bacterium 13_2_20CM_2_71_6]